MPKADEEGLRQKLILAVVAALVGACATLLGAVTSGMVAVSISKDQVENANRTTQLAYLSLLSASLTDLKNTESKEIGKAYDDRVRKSPEFYWIPDLERAIDRAINRLQPLPENFPPPREPR